MFWYILINHVNFWSLLQLNGEGDWEYEEIALERVSSQ